MSYVSKERQSEGRMEQLQQHHNQKRIRLMQAMKDMLGKKATPTNSYFRQLAISNIDGIKRSTGSHPEM
eukprot:scaffold10210_cov199-Chaetoceros_neogracile.AAC.9